MIQMRIVVLGCGEVGEAAVRELAKADEVTEITITGRPEDYSLARARSITKELGEKVSAEHADATDHKSLIKVMKDADAVVNFIGPYYKFGVPVVKAAVEAGVNYVDIQDDYGSTQRLLDDVELNKSAEDAGISAILGLGISPGQTNVFAKYGADKLDEVEEIHTAWAFTTASGAASTAAMYHMLEVISGKVPTYEDGKWIDVVPFVDGEETIEFLEPLGKVKVYHVGHPEPVTIPRYIKGVKVVDNKAGIVPPEVSLMYRCFVDYGLADEEPMTIQGVKIKPRDFLIEHTMSLPEERIVKVFRLEEVQPLFGCRIEVKGKKEGITKRYIYQYLSEDYYRATYVPAIIAAIMLGRGEIEAKGITAPEGCIDPEPFIKRLVERGIAWYTTTEEKTKLA